MGSAPTIFQGRPLVEINTHVEQDERTSSSAAARKLTFSKTVKIGKYTAAKVVQGNRSQQLWMKLDYFPPNNERWDENSEISPSRS